MKDYGGVNVTDASRSAAVAVALRIWGQSSISVLLFPFEEFVTRKLQNFTLKKFIWKSESAAFL